MAGERRSPPLLFWRKIYRFLSGDGGWRGILIQLLLLFIIVWFGYEIVANTKANLRDQNIATGLGFLHNSAGFDVSLSLISYNESDTYARVFFVGLLNTLLVSFIGIIFATLIGFLVGVGRLSPNWLIARLSSGYVELIRNLPLLFQILFWYLAVLSALPSPRQSISLFDVIFLSNRGLVTPKPVPQESFGAFVLALIIGVVIALGLQIYSRRHHLRTGHSLRLWPYGLAALIGLPLAVMLILGKPFTLDMPALKGFNFAGGARLIPELVALAVALSTYTASFIAENVRSGIQSVSRGQMEAGASLGLSRGQTLRMIILPQALQVIIPPLTNQYLNLIKNSSLAVAIGYPDLFAVFAGTSLSQTGQAIEIIAMTMGIYLLISLITSALMNFYEWRIRRVSRG